jgi:hypothetical protein
MQLYSSGVLQTTKFLTTFARGGGHWTGRAGAGESIGVVSAKADGVWRTTRGVVADDVGGQVE